MFLHSLHTWLSSVFRYHVSKLCSFMWPTKLLRGFRHEAAVEQGQSLLTYHQLVNFERSLLYILTYCCAASITEFEACVDHRG